MARPGGNPDFGTKYRFVSNREKLLSEQVKVSLCPEMKHLLKNLIREAIEQYLDSKQTTQAS
jgi:hypothetical protein